MELNQADKANTVITIGWKPLQRVGLSWIVMVLTRVN